MVNCADLSFSKLHIATGGTGYGGVSESGRMVKKVVRRVSSSEEWRHLLRLALDLGHSQFATSTKTVQPD